MDKFLALMPMISDFNVDWATLIVKGSVLKRERFEMKHVLEL